MLIKMEPIWIRAILLVCLASNISVAQQCIPASCHSKVEMTNNLDVDFAAGIKIPESTAGIPGPDVALPPEHLDTISGWDVEDIYFSYSVEEDRACFALKCWKTYQDRVASGICGDADGDGDPGGASDWLTAGGGVDRPNFEASEDVYFLLDMDNDLTTGNGGYDVLVGIPTQGSFADFGVYVWPENFPFQAAPFLTNRVSVDGVSLEMFPYTPNVHVGTTLGPNAMEPSLEFCLSGFSNLPHFTMTGGEFELRILGSQSGGSGDTVIAEDSWQFNVCVSGCVEPTTQTTSATSTPTTTKTTSPTTSKTTSQTTSRTTSQTTSITTSPTTTITTTPTTTPTRSVVQQHYTLNPVFTGDAANDFAFSTNVEGAVAISDPLGDIAPSSAGFDISDFFFSYDFETDTAYFAISCGSNICGDRDADGDPGAGDDDFPDYRSEVLALILDTDTATVDGDAMISIPIGGSLRNLTVFDITNATDLDISAPNETLIKRSHCCDVHIFDYAPIHPSSMEGPTSAQPSLEFSVSQFSELPGFTFVPGQRAQVPFTLHHGSQSDSDQLSGEIIVEAASICPGGRTRLPLERTPTNFSGLASADYVFSASTDLHGDTPAFSGANDDLSSGWDILATYFAYDPLSDTATIAIDCAGICGDADGDGDPGNHSLLSGLSGGRDSPNYGDGEHLVILLDIDDLDAPLPTNDRYDLAIAICGAGDFSSVAMYDITSMSNLDSLCTETPAPMQVTPFAYLDGLHQSTSLGPNSMQPSLEFTLPNFSSLFSTDFTPGLPFLFHYKILHGGGNDLIAGEDEAVADVCIGKYGESPNPCTTCSNGQTMLKQCTLAPFEDTLCRDDIELLGGPILLADASTPFDDPGISPTDVPYSTEGTVDPSTPGIYRLKYWSDFPEFAPSTVTRDVLVVDLTPPTIEVLQASRKRRSLDDSIFLSPVSIPVGDEFSPFDVVIATDNVDGVVTSSIRIHRNTVDTSMVGVYHVEYSARDSRGNVGRAVLPVEVVDTDAARSVDDCDHCHFAGIDCWLFVLIVAIIILLLCCLCLLCCWRRNRVEPKEYDIAMEEVIPVPPKIEISELDLTGKRVLIKNLGTQPVSLDGYSLRTQQNHRVFTFHDLTLDAGDWITVWCDTSHQATGYDNERSVVWNEGDQDRSPPLDPRRDEVYLMNELQTKISTKAATVACDIIVSKIDPEKQLIVLRNQGPATNLSGCCITCHTSSRQFVFDDNEFEFPANETLNIWCNPGATVDAPTEPNNRNVFWTSSKGVISQIPIINPDQEDVSIADADGKIISYKHVPIGTTLQLTRIDLKEDRVWITNRGSRPCDLDSYYLETMASGNTQTYQIPPYVLDGGHTLSVRLSRPTRMLEDTLAENDVYIDSVGSQHVLDLKGDGIRLFVIGDEVGSIRDPELEVTEVNLDKQYVVVHNHGTQRHSLAGCQLDSNSMEVPFTFPSVFVLPKSDVTVYGSDEYKDELSEPMFKWNLNIQEQGDSITLVDPNKKLLSSKFVAGSQPEAAPQMIAVSDREPLVIDAVDQSRQLISLRNTSEEPVDITNFVITSHVSGRSLTVPESTLLQGNSNININCGPNSDEAENSLDWKDGRGRWLSPGVLNEQFEDVSIRNTQGICLSHRRVPEDGELVIVKVDREKDRIYLTNFGSRDVNLRDYSLSSFKVPVGSFSPPSKEMPSRVVEAGGSVWVWLSGDPQGHHSESDVVLEGSSTPMLDESGDGAKLSLGKNVVSQMYDPEIEILEANGDMQYLTIVNNGSKKKDLQSYCVEGMDFRSRYTIPKCELGPKETLVIYAVDNPGDFSRSLKWNGVNCVEVPLMFNRRGDTARLINPDGVIESTAEIPSKSSSDLHFSSMNLEDDYISITNDSNAVTYLHGYKIALASTPKTFTCTGSQDAKLSPGETATLSPSDTETSMLGKTWNWTDSRMLAKDQDTAYLLDPKGAIVTQRKEVRPEPEPEPEPLIDEKKPQLITFTGEIAFKSNKSDLLDAGKEVVNTVIAKLNTHLDVDLVEIGGHACGGGDEARLKNYRRGLSERRAKAVMDYMIQEGISSSRLMFKGYGTSQPITTNETEEGREQNRRVEFKILKRGGVLVTEPSD